MNDIASSTDWAALVQLVMQERPSTVFLERGNDNTPTQAKSVLELVGKALDEGHFSKAVSYALGQSDMVMVRNIQLAIIEAQLSRVYLGEDYAIMAGNHRHGAMKREEILAHSVVALDAAPSKRRRAIIASIARLVLFTEMSRPASERADEMMTILNQSQRYDTITLLSILVDLLDSELINSPGFDMMGEMTPFGYELLSTSIPKSDDPVAIVNVVTLVPEHKSVFVDYENAWKSVDELAASEAPLQSDSKWIDLAFRFANYAFATRLGEDLIMKIQESVLNTNGFIQPTDSGLIHLVRWLAEFPNPSSIDVQRRFTDLVAPTFDDEHLNPTFSLKDVEFPMGCFILTILNAAGPASSTHRVGDVIDKEQAQALILASGQARDIALWTECSRHPHARLEAVSRLIDAGEPALSHYLTQLCRWPQAAHRPHMVPGKVWWLSADSESQEQDSAAITKKMIAARVDHFSLWCWANFISHSPSQMMLIQAMVHDELGPQYHVQMFTRGGPKDARLKLRNVTESCFSNANIDFLVRDAVMDCPARDAVDLIHWLLEVNPPGLDVSNITRLARHVVTDGSRSQVEKIMPPLFKYLCDNGYGPEIGIENGPGLGLGVPRSR